MPRDAALESQAPLPSPRSEDRSQGEHKSRVFGLDLMRAAAILCVLAAHAPYEEAWRPFKEARSFLAFFGVELFFVLSGFLIGGILLRLFDASCSLKQVKVFWTRRWFRTLPNYFLFLIVNSLLFLPKDLAGDWHFLVFLQNFAWPHPQFFPESWSLAIEEWFYLILPLLVLGLSALTRNTRVSFAIAISLIIVSVTVGRWFYITYAAPWSWDEVVRKIVVLRLDALMYGVFGAYVKHHWKSSWISLRPLLAGIGLAGLAAVVWLFFDSFGNELRSRTLLLTLNSASIACLLPVFDSWRRTVGGFARWVTWISIWSYSMYLCHLPLRALFFELGGGLLRWGSGWNVLSPIIWFLGTVLLSKVVYQYFESRMTALRERFG